MPEVARFYGISIKIFFGDPKVISATAIDDTTLLIEFSNHDRKQYCIKPLLKKPMFSPLQNPSFFRNFQIDNGGYGIIWNDEMDLSEYELWRNGTDVVVDDSRSRSIVTG